MNLSNECGVIDNVFYDNLSDNSHDWLNNDFLESLPNCNDALSKLNIHIKSKVN